MPTTTEATVPSLGRRALNFAKAAAGHLAAGMPRSSNALVVARLAVCREGVGLTGSDTVDGHCVHYIPSKGVCGNPGDGTKRKGCGCHVAAKAAWRDQACPRGWWPAPESIS